MSAKLIDWTVEVQQTIARLQKSGLVFEFEPSAALIDYLAARKIAPRVEVLAWATILHGPKAESFVASTLANVTMAIHPKGNVPDPGGWYFHDDTTDMYVLDRGFSDAWRAVRSPEAPN